MAKCSVKTETTVTRIVNLELTEEEVKFLLTILEYVGGNPEQSARRHQSPISRALEGTGIKRLYLDCRGPGGMVQGSLSFRDDPFV